MPAMPPVAASRCMVVRRTPAVMGSRVVLPRLSAGPERGSVMATHSVCSN